MAEPAQIQFLRGKKEINDSFVGPPGGVTVDIDNWEIRVHDGVKPGGHVSRSKENTERELQQTKQRLTIDKSFDRSELVAMITLLAKRVKRLEAIVESLQHPPSPIEPPIDIIVSPPDHDLYVVEKQYLHLRQQVIALSRRVKKAVYRLEKTMG
jgi:hypothetical protein